MSPTILIVGASSGIGKETALKFAKKNWKVIACSRNSKKLNDLKFLSIKNKYKKILPFKLDITKSNKLKFNINKIIRDFGIPDIVFLNAGTNNPNSREIVNYVETKKLFDTNFFGIINCIDILLPFMKKKKVLN
jgi:NADP-dependent 3-hydroxy acid dehydrogenase YdfG